MKPVHAVLLAAVAVAGCKTPPQTPATRPIEPPSRPATRPATPTTAPGLLPATAPATQQAHAEPIILPPAPPIFSRPEPIAVVDGIEISRDRVVQAVMEAHGLNMLLRIAQVEMAKNLTEKEHLEVSAADIAKERKDTLYRMGKDANQRLLDDIAEAQEKKDDARAQRLKEQFDKDAETILVQTLARENMTVGEFDLLMEANAYLRKFVEKQLAGKITDENVHEAFLNLYGENVRVRHIQLANMAEVSAAQKRLADGASFQQVAKEMSRNAKTRALGGELLPFSRETQNLPEAFKQAAFTLKKPGEVSDIVEANGSYHLIQLVERLSPKAVKYEDVKDSVRQQLFDRWVVERMKLIRDHLGRQAMDTIRINDPVLASQYRDRVNRRETEMKERDQIARQLNREHDAQVAKSQANTRPEAGELRPPATKSGSDTPDNAPTTSPANN